MTSPAIAWMSEPAVQALIARFPMALALVGTGDRVEFVNERFSNLFDPACLQAEVLRRIADKPSESWQLVRLMRRNGSEIDVQVQSIGIQQSTLLVIDESPELVSRQELEGLRRHVVELERLSSTDRLTGAWNRAHLDRVVESELARSGRSRQPVSIVLLDIDHFKRVNDTFGHQAGDSVLRELVQVVGSVIRLADVLFRWGGEEFVVLAASTSYAGAATLAEHMRSAVERHEFALVGSVTISLGVAEHIASESAETWFRRVDKGLYEAKEGGRNRACVDRRGSSDMWAVEDGPVRIRLAWQEAYECGEPTIDREHRELFYFANRLLDAALTKEASPGALDAALDALLTHIARHFADEEALLAQHGYAHLKAHQRAHAGLLARASALKAAAVAGKATLGDLVEFLADQVVAQHLFKADRDFFPLFRK